MRRVRPGHACENLGSTYFVGWGSRYRHSAPTRLQRPHFGLRSSHLDLRALQVSQAWAAMAARSRRMAPSEGPSGDEGPPAAVGEKTLMALSCDGGHIQAQQDDGCRRRGKVEISLRTQKTLRSTQADAAPCAAQRVDTCVQWVAARGNSMQRWERGLTAMTLEGWRERREVFRQRVACDGGRWPW